MVTTTSQKFVDQHTKWKEIFLIKEKTQTVDYLELFNKSLVIPTGFRLDRLKADKGTELASSAFEQYRRDTAVKLSFLLPTPHNKLESGAASPGERDSRGGSASRGLRGARGGRGGTAPRGGRGGSTPQRPTTRSVAQAPNARTVSEL